MDEDGSGCGRIVDGVGWFKLNVFDDDEEELMTNRPLQVNGLNNKNLEMKEGEKVVLEKTELLQFNGLNNKNMESKENEKVVLDETELLQFSGLNNKNIGNAVEKNGCRAESKCKFRMQTQRKAETEEDESNGERSRWGARQCDRQRSWSRMREQSNSNMPSTIRSVSEEVEKEMNSPLQDNGLNENKHLVNSKYNDDLGEGNRIQKPIPKPRKSLVQTHNSDITRFRNNFNDNNISNTIAQQTIRRGLCPDWVSKLGSPPPEIAHLF